MMIKDVLIKELDKKLNSPLGTRKPIYQNIIENITN